MDYRLLWSCFLYVPLAFKSGHSQNTSVQNMTQSVSTVGRTGLTPSSSYTIHATVANTFNVSLTTVHSSSTTVSTSKQVSNITPSINASNINNYISTPSNSVSSNYAISETTPPYFTPPFEQPLSTYNTQYATSSKLAPSYSTATSTTTTRKTATSTTDTVSLTTLTPASTATPSISRATPPLDTIYTTTSTPTPPISAAPTDTIMRTNTTTTLTVTSTSTNPQTTTAHDTISTAAYQITSAITSTPSFTNSSQTSFTASVVSSKSTSTYSFTTKPTSTQPDRITAVAPTTTIPSSAGESVTTEHSPSSSTARLTISTLTITPFPSSTAKVVTSIDSTSKIVLPFTTESAVTILSTVKHTMSTITPPSTKAAGTANKSTISASYFATKPTPGSPSITKYKSTIHTITSVTKPTEVSSVMTGVTVSIATEPTTLKPTTGDTMNIPKVFFVIASINLKWNDHYGIFYTEDYKKLKEQLETALQKELEVLDGFFKVYIIRFFKGSVKFESEVYFDQSSSVNEESLSTKIESTDIGKLGKIEVIKVERNKDNTSTVQNSKPLLQPWMIVAIAAGAVVLIYTIILIILMVKFRRLKRLPASRSRSSIHFGEEDRTFFNMALVNNNYHGSAVEDNGVETFSWRKTSTIERPELQTFVSIEEASDDKKDDGNDVTSNHDNHSPVMTFNVGSDSSGSINESKEKDDVSEQTDSEADYEMNEDEAEAKKEKEPEPGEQDRLVEKESNVSPFY